MTVACYLRVSTEDQSFDRQLESTHDYARDRLGAELPEIDTYRDASTGTDTERSGYQELMERVENGAIRAVVTHSVSRISRSIRDLERTVDRFESAGVELHLVSEGLTLRPGDDDPFQDALFRLLGVFAQLEADMIQQRVREGIAARQASDDYHHGPAPLGFEKDDGQLIQGERYDQVVAILEMVRDRNLSKRKAARELDTSRRTINRALDRAELYGV